MTCRSGCRQFDDLPSGRRPRARRLAPQTNIVRRDGHRGTLVTILKTGSASTLDVVAGIRAVLPRVIPPSHRSSPSSRCRQSIFVRAAVSGVIARR